jgi:DNA-binding FadR family transcriptional regulator
MKAGDALPPEREMLVEYGVGRGTLREALRYLEMQGVITIRPGPGGGPAVNQPGPRHLARNLSIILEFARTPLRAIVETRSVIEPAIAASAATRIDAEHLQEIKRSVERMRDNPGNLDIFLTENEHFHDLIAWSSDNTVFGYLLSSLHWISDGTVMGVQYPLWAQKVVAKAHKRIYEAIASGDPERSKEAMTAHVAEYARYLEERYPELLDQTIRWDRLPS